jgi:Tfp pilus assembly protein PilO
MISRLLPILAFVAAVLIFFLYVNPTYNGTIASTQAAITSDNQSLAAATAYTAKENQLISAKNQIDPAALARLTTFLPDSSDDVGLILDLDALAAADGLSLTSVNVADQSTADASGGSTSATAPTTPYASLDLTIAATGSYASFRSFLGSIESSERLLDVEQLTVKGSDTGVYTYAMTLRLYWLQ